MVVSSRVILGVSQSSQQKLHLWQSLSSLLAISNGRAYIVRSKSRNAIKYLFVGACFRCHYEESRLGPLMRSPLCLYLHYLLLSRVPVQVYYKSAGTSARLYRFSIHVLSKACKPRSCPNSFQNMSSVSSYRPVLRLSPEFRQLSGARRVDNN